MILKLLSQVNDLKSEWWKVIHKLRNVRHIHVVEDES